MNRTLVSSVPQRDSQLTGACPAARKMFLPLLLVLAALGNQALAKDPVTLKTQPSAALQCLAVSADGKRIVAGSLDPLVYVWDSTGRDTFKQVNVFKGHNDKEVRAVAISPDATLVASGGGDFLIKVWEAASGKVKHTFTGPPEPSMISSLTFSPDGKRLAAAFHDELVVKVWDLDKNKELVSFVANEKTLRCVRFSPDGKLLATAADDKVVRLWNATDGKEVLVGNDKDKKPLVFRGHTAAIRSVAFSPDGKQLATGSDDSTVRFWDVATGNELSSQRSHQGPVFGVSYSSDSKRLASASLDNTLKIWDAATGKELATLAEKQQGHINRVYDVVFVPLNNKRLMSVSWDETVKVWDLD